MADRAQLLSHFLFLAARELRDEAERAEPCDARMLFHLARHLAQLTALHEGHDQSGRDMPLARLERQARSWSAAAIAVDLPGFRHQTHLWLDLAAGRMEQERAPRHEWAVAPFG